MKRDEALELVRSKITAKNLIKHMLATEACMRRLAREFGEDAAEIVQSFNETNFDCLPE